MDREHLEETPMITFSDMDSYVGKFANMIQSKDFDTTAAEELYRKLITPLRPYIRHRNLVIIPHGPLHNIPFAALRNLETGRLMVEDYTITYAPRVSVLAHFQEKRDVMSWRALILGDPEAAGPELKYAREEAVSIASALGVEPFIGEEASETLVREHGARSDLIHLAAHGVYDAENSRLSHIALAADEHHDGRLEVGELFDEIDLSGVNLVVLSACETALGERTRGDDITSLTRAFLYAGSSAVVSTLWSSDDAASSVLMEAFYCRLFGGSSPAKALREAQLELLASEKYAAPHYWAAFTLTGDHGSGFETVDRPLPPRCASR